MRVSKFRILLILMILWSIRTFAQEYRSEGCVTFRVNSTRIETEYKDNAAQISEFISFLKQVLADSTLHVTDINFSGTASPEGSYELNKKLAKGRMEAFERLIRSQVEIPDSLVTYNDDYIHWELLSSLVEASDLPQKDKILEIIHEKAEIVDYIGNRSIDRRVLRLKELDGGKPWKELNKHFFNRMRNASTASVTYKRKEFTSYSPTLKEIDLAYEPGAPIRPDFVQPLELSPSSQWHRRILLKTNALGWGLAISNAAVEIDLFKHWSFNLPVYYSAWNYFSSTVKFRTFSIQPEVRYWLSGRNDGLFAGAHFGLTYYNIATNGDYRTQDHNGTSPSLGGGLAVGYRLPISKDNRWKVEFSAGAGVYGLHYDRFHNYTNGLRVDTKKKTYFGLDQLSVTFSYSFHLKKGGLR